MVMKSISIHFFICLLNELNHSPLDRCLIGLSKEIKPSYDPVEIRLNVRTGMMSHTGQLLSAFRHEKKGIL